MKVGIISLGCAKNTVDTENMMGILSSCGCTFSNEPSECDVLICNTCGFIQSAKEESINSILELAQYKKLNPNIKLVATGCLTERYRQELADLLPEVDIILGVREYDKLPKLLMGQNNCAPAHRLLLTPPYRAYLRIGDGCNNRCSYCAIPLIRGNLNSVPMELLIDEAKRLADQGVSELTLIAQDTSGYGKDIYGQARLIDLLKQLDKISSLHWIRLLYTYPDTVTPQLLDCLCSSNKLVPYLDMPLQHINDGILKRMNRRGDKRHICSVLDYLRKNYPQMTLRTTMMVGFPGETEGDFQELLKFLRDYPFDRVGAFCYSPEEGTPSCRFDDQVEDGIKQRRLDELMRQQRDISFEMNIRWLGEQFELLVESIEGGTTYGRTVREAPDADGLVTVSTKPHHAIGAYIPIQLTQCDCYDSKGKSL